MIKVNCPACAANYDLDERRVPSNGLKMRCPQCAHRMRVYPDGSVTRDSGPPAPPPPAVTSATLSSARTPNTKDAAASAWGKAPTREAVSASDTTAKPSTSLGGIGLFGESDDDFRR
ncbi:MAG: zinc-ribbon domain-containing protein [Polyangiales bacterium]